MECEYYKIVEGLKDDFEKEINKLNDEGWFIWHDNNVAFDPIKNTLWYTTIMYKPKNT